MKTASVCLLLGSACLFAVAANASAADLTVSVGDASGKPVAAAVVTFTPAAGAQISAANRAGPFTMAQKNIQFAPYVLAVPVGATVDFPNQDRVNHHVYSFSPVQPFQFPLYGQGKKRSLRFDHIGTVALACNIHDSMSAYIRIVDTPYYATTDQSGRVTLKDLPQGAGTLTVWQPMLDAPDHAVSRQAQAGGTQSFSLKLKAAALVSSGAY